MIAFWLIFCLVLYIISNALSIYTIYILCTCGTIHRNFRTILLASTVSGIAISVSTYLQVIASFIDDIVVQTNMNFVAYLMVTFLGGIFTVSNMTICIERGFAVFYVKKYEEWSSFKWTVPVILIFLIVPVDTFVYFFGTGNVLMIFNFVCYSTGVIISTLIILKQWLKSRTSQISSVPLGERFQQVENNWTRPIFFAISLNEMISGISFIYNALEFTAKQIRYNIMDEQFNVVFLNFTGVERIIFIQATFIIFFLKSKNNQKKVAKEVQLTENEKATQRFDQLNSMWQTTLSQA